LAGSSTMKSFVIHGVSVSNRKFCTLMPTISFS
jgi:hypothetical protein